MNDFCMILQDIMIIIWYCKQSSDEVFGLKIKEMFIILGKHAALRYLDRTQ